MEGTITQQGEKTNMAGPGLTASMQIFWWLLVVINLTLYLIAIPVEYQSHVLSSTRDLSAALTTLRLTPQFYAVLRTSLDLTTELAFTLIGAVIILRKPGDWMVFLVALSSVTFSSLFVPTLIMLAEQNTLFRLPAAIIRTIGLATSIIVFLYLFPNGRFYPRFTRIFAAVWVFLSIFWLVTPGARFNIVHLTDWSTNMPGIVATLFLAYATGIFAQLYRYKKTTHPVQKQQIKWFLYGSVAALLGFGFYYLGLIAIPIFSQNGLPRLLYFLIGLPIYHLSILMVPLTLAIAISRFRLWDVDTLINRSMVYTALTALMIALYILAVVAFEQAFHWVFDWDRSPAAVALSTLLIAYLIGPLKNLIQKRIDRRFYRHRYSADLAIAELSVKLRDEVDIQRLAEALVNTIDETMQPEHISLWLRQKSNNTKEG